VRTPLPVSTISKRGPVYELKFSLEPLTNWNESFGKVEIRSPPEKNCRLCFFAAFHCEGFKSFVSFAYFPHTNLDKSRCPFSSAPVTSKKYLFFGWNRVSIIRTGWKQDNASLDVIDRGLESFLHTFPPVRLADRPVARFVYRTIKSDQLTDR